MPWPATGADAGRSRDLVNGLDIERIRPEPDRMMAAVDGMHFEFGMAGTEQSVEIAFSIKLQKIGRIGGGLIGYGPARLSRFIYRISQGHRRLCGSLDDFPYVRAAASGGVIRRDYAGRALPCGKRDRLIPTWGCTLP